jgi:hypothetical protein
MAMIRKEGEVLTAFRWESFITANVATSVTIIFPSVRFTNRTYFEAKIPKRLLRARKILDGAFFSIDGMSTGCIFMQFHGLILAIPLRPANLTEIDFFAMKIFRGFDMLGSTL